jgi:rare lipoprotein A
MLTGKSLSRLPALGLIGALAVGLGGCGGLGPDYGGDRDGPGEPRDVSRVPDAVPRVEPLSRGGNPESYVVFGDRYYPLRDSKGFVERGIASWYGRKFHGRNTSNGERYDMYTMSAAHKLLPIPTYVQVTNLENGRKVVVRVNDRGPFHENRVIDLSYAAAARIGMLGKGTALVEIRAIDPRAPTTRVAAAPAQQQPAPLVAVPAPPVPEPAAPTTPAAPRIFLQAGAFSSNDNAERLRDRLKQGLAREVRVIPAMATTGSVLRVQVGPLASVEIADEVTAQLHELGVAQPLVVID